MKRTIVVTGGCKGLGKSIAERLSKNKDNLVVIVSNDAPCLEDTSKQLSVPFYVCDVTKSDDIKKAVAEITKEFGTIDVLINNAGIILDGELDTYNDAQIEKVFDVNALGTIYFAQAVIPGMKAKKSGVILNVGSQGGLVGREERSVYNASKWAITGFTESLRKELSPYKISVLGIYPTLLKTGLFQNAGIDHDLSKGLDPNDVARVIEFMLSFDELQMAQVVVGSVNYQY